MSKISSVQHFYQGALDQLCNKYHKAGQIWKEAYRIYNKKRITRKDASRIANLLGSAADIFTEDLRQLHGISGDFHGISADWAEMERGYPVKYLIRGRDVKTRKHTTKIFR